MALTKIGASLGGGANTITITQSGHGLLIGRPVKVSGANEFSHATADSVANAEAVGIVIITDSSGTNTTFTLALSGRVTVDGCVPTGTPGDVLFLNTTAGIVTATEPSGNNEVSKPMAVLVTSGSEMILINYRGEQISTTGIALGDDSVTNAKLANMATRTIKANATSGSANPTDVVLADGDFLIATDSALVTVPITGDVVISNAGVATIQTDAVDIAMLSASGTASSSTFLAGNNAWAAAGGKGVIQVHPQTYTGTYRIENQGDLPVVALGTGTAVGTIGYSFQLPSDLALISECYVVYMNMGNSLAIGIGCTTDYGQINESRNINSGSIATAYVAKGINEWAEYDVTSALSNANAGDHVGILITRQGDNPSDLANDVGFAHLVLEYTR